MKPAPPGSHDGVGATALGGNRAVQAGLAVAATVAVAGAALTGVTSGSASQPRLDGEQSAATYFRARSDATGVAGGIALLDGSGPRTTKFVLFLGGLPQRNHVVQLIARTADGRTAHAGSWRVLASASEPPGLRTSGTAPVAASDIRSVEVRLAGPLSASLLTIPTEQ
jgi:hypothetical protein